MRVPSNSISACPVWCVFRGGHLLGVGVGGGEVALFMLCDGGMVCQTEE